MDLYTITGREEEEEEEKEERDWNQREIMVLHCEGLQVHKEKL